jgi:hypothetical protein
MSSNTRYRSNLRFAQPLDTPFRPVHVMRLSSHSLATRVHTRSMIFKVIFALGILNQRWLSCKSAQGTDDNATESLQAAQARSSNQ